MKIVVVPSARADMRRIYSYISQDSKTYARATIRRIIEIIEGTAKHPLSGRIVPEYEDPKIREHIYKSYRIIYRIKTDLIEVISVYHAARVLK